MALLTFTPSPFKGNPSISSAPSRFEVKLAPVSLIRGNKILVFAKIQKNGGVKNTKIPFNITNLTVLMDKSFPKSNLCKIKNKFCFLL